MPEMTEFFVFVGDNPEAEGGEGVVGAFTPAGNVQLATHRPTLRDRFRPLAQQISDQTGRSVRLVRFVRAEVLEEIRPRPQG